MQKYPKYFRNNNGKKAMAPFYDASIYNVASNYDVVSTYNVASTHNFTSTYDIASTYGVASTYNVSSTYNVASTYDVAVYIQYQYTYYKMHIHQPHPTTDINPQLLAVFIQYNHVSWGCLCALRAQVWGMCI